MAWLGESGLLEVACYVSNQERKIKQTKVAGRREDVGGDGAGMLDRDHEALGGWDRAPLRTPSKPLPSRERVCLRLAQRLATNCHTARFLRGCMVFACFPHTVSLF